MHYNNLVSLAPFSSILEYRPQEDTFFYISVSKGLEDFYNISSKDFINKPLYFSVSKTRDIDIKKCHEKFTNLIMTSLRYGSSIEILKLSTFLKTKNKDKLVCIISLRIKNNVLLNLGFPISESLFLKSSTRIDLLKDTLSSILDNIDSNIIIIDQSLNILYVNRYLKNDYMDHSFKEIVDGNIFSDINRYIEDTVSIYDKPNIFCKEYKIDNVSYKVKVNPILEGRELVNIFIIIIEDITEYQKLVLKSKILQKELDTQKDKIDIILRGYKSSKEESINDNPNLDLVRRITTATIKGKVKSITPMDHQLIGILKDIEDMKKDHERLMNNMLNSDEKISSKVSELELFINKTDHNIKSIEKVLNELEKERVSSEDLTLLNVLLMSPKNQLIILFIIIIISAVLLEDIVIEKVKNYILNPSSVIEEILEE